MNKLIYLCNYLLESDFHHKEVRNCGPAANQKVHDICTSLNMNGVDVSVISSRIGHFSDLKFYEPMLVKNTEFGKVYYCPILKYKYINRAMTPFFLLFTLLYVTKVERKKSDSNTILFYNRQPYYWATLLLSKLKSYKVIFDIEDEYSDLEKRRFPYHVIKKLNERYSQHFETENKLIVANMSIEKETKKERFACYGAVEPKRKPLQNKDKLSLLFCGTINEETGSRLLEKAILKIDKLEIKKNILLNISGFGEDSERLRKLVLNLDWVQYHGNVTRDEYEELLITSHVGISLKRPGTFIGTTTFPSKVVEFVKNGLAVISYELTDVKQVLGEHAFWIGEGESIEDTIIKIVTNDERTPFEVAILSQKKLVEDMGCNKVGFELKRFLSL